MSSFQKYTQFLHFESAFARGHVHIFFTIFNILCISNLWFQFPFLIPFWHWAQNCNTVQCEPGVAVVVVVVFSFVLWRQPQLSRVVGSLEGPEPSLHSSLFGSHTLCHSEPRPYIHPAPGTPPLWEWAHLKSLQEFLVQASQRYLHLFQSHRFYRSIETGRISNMRASSPSSLSTSSSSWLCFTVSNSQLLIIFLMSLELLRCSILGLLIWFLQEIVRSNGSRRRYHHVLISL